MMKKLYSLLLLSLFVIATFATVSEEDEVSIQIRLIGREFGFEFLYDPFSM